MPLTPLTDFVGVVVAAGAPIVIGSAVMIITRRGVIDVFRARRARLYSSFVFRPLEAELRFRPHP
jgi:hypothetical protein